MTATVAVSMAALKAVVFVFAGANTLPLPGVISQALYLKVLVPVNPPVGTKRTLSVGPSKIALVALTPSSESQRLAPVLKNCQSPFVRSTLTMAMPKVVPTSRSEAADPNKFVAVSPAEFVFPIAMLGNSTFGVMSNTGLSFTVLNVTTAVPTAVLKDVFTSVVKVEPKVPGVPCV